MSKLSVVLATYNESENIEKCLLSIVGIADEIFIVDGGSTDRTVDIAEKYNARVLVKDNPPIFHVNKQIALDGAKYDWILQLDADERVTPRLAHEIKSVIKMELNVLEKYQSELPNRDLFLRHQRLIEQRDGKIGDTSGAYSAFFIPRLNYFLGKYLKYGGVYPDGVIRLIKKGKARFPSKSVHEQIEVTGRVGWLTNDLLHIDSPTFGRYLARNSRYIDLISKELQSNKVKKNIIKVLEYFVIRPVWWFLLTTIRHKGILDGWQGVVFSFFSALRFPRAYWRYLISKNI